MLEGLILLKSEVNLRRRRQSCNFYILEIFSINFDDF